MCDVESSDGYSDAAKSFLNDWVTEKHRARKVSALLHLSGSEPKGSLYLK